MSESDRGPTVKSLPDQASSAPDANEGLRQALIRLTIPGSAPLRENLDALRQELLSIAEAIHQAEAEFQQRGQALSQRDQELLVLIQDLSARQDRLAESIGRLEGQLGQQIRAETGSRQGEIQAIRSNLADPEQNAERAAPVLVPLLNKQAREDGDRFAEALAPVIGPAIRHQIREARQDIIDALYPLIGQIIGKAVAESIRELARSIDARLRQQNPFSARLSRFSARIRGVSAAELALRDSLPYRVHRVFLIQRNSGLLLEHLSAPGEAGQENIDLISSMLTAIRDFVRDSFQEDQADLEEIAYGDQRILLETAQNAFLAVVISGVEPAGYHQQVRSAINQINVQYENEIRGFNGDLQSLPDFKSNLLPLIVAPFPFAESISRPLTHSQKISVAAALGGLILLLALLAFACVYTVRLWPFVFK